MLDYKDLCKTLKDAVLLTPSPNYEIKHVNQFDDPYGLLQKVEFRYGKWVNWTSVMDSNSTAFCVGCCPIDRFSGNEVLSV